MYVERKKKTSRRVKEKQYNSVWWDWLWSWHGGWRMGAWKSPATSSLSSGECWYPSPYHPEENELFSWLFSFPPPPRPLLCLSPTSLNLPSPTLLSLSSSFHFLSPSILYLYLMSHSPFIVHFSPSLFFTLAFLFLSITLLFYTFFTPSTPLFLFVSNTAWLRDVTWSRSMVISSKRLNWIESVTLAKLLGEKSPNGGLQEECRKFSTIWCMLQRMDSYVILPTRVFVNLQWYSEQH